MHWEDLPETIDAWVEKCSAPGRLIKSAASNVITSTHVGYYFNPISAAVGIFAPMASVSDTALVKAAAVRATGTPPLFLSYQDLTNPNGSWVKVAYSPALRRAGELLNFFPSTTGIAWTHFLYSGAYLVAGPSTICQGSYEHVQREFERILDFMQTS